MNKMEKIKNDKHGLLVLDDILRYTSGSVEDIPDDDMMRFRWYGLFHRKREGGFMLRVRVPNGVMTSNQLRALASAAAVYGDGHVTITTRSGVQLRTLALADIPAVFELMKASGLEIRQTGSDNIRNLMNCPLAGLQEDEAFDATSIIDEISRNIIGNPAYSALPRKFNISVTGCCEDCAHSFLNDVGLVPQTIDGQHGFRLRMGGALGKTYAEVAEDMGVWIAKEDGVAAVMALLELFNDHGNRENRNKAPALLLAKQLDENEILPDGFRIHWSGCPNSCATTQFGDIGLRGTKTRVNGELVDAVDIFAGGRIGHEAAIGELVKEKVPITDLYTVLSGMLARDKARYTGSQSKAQ